jgi:hypothetical protein
MQGVEVIIGSAAVLSEAITPSSFTQNAGSVLTLTAQALAGVAITSQSVSLAGDLVLDLTGLDVYDGMAFTLISAANITGVWDRAHPAGSFSECNQVSVSVDYTQNSAVATLSIVSLCNAGAVVVLPWRILALLSIYAL